MCAAERLRLLRTAMAAANVAALIVPSADAHMSEYLAPADQQRAYISGFTGSSGTAVVTKEKAALWTDGRYFLQASQQLDASCWRLMKDGIEGTPTTHEWVAGEVDDGERVGVEASRLSRTEAIKFRKELAKKKAELVAVEEALFAACWPDRPAKPAGPAFVYDLKYAGKSSAEKITQIQELVKKEGAEALVVAALDEVAWLLNVRGSDIAFTPLVFSFVLLTLDGVTWFIDSSKLTDEVREHTKHVTIAPYEEVTNALAALNRGGKRTKVWLDPSKCSMALFEQVPEEQQHTSNSPIARPQATKNAVELEGLRASSVRDSGALVEYFHWLEKEVTAGTELDECSVAAKLHDIRSGKHLFFSESFDTISSAGANGAIIHYKPKKGSCAKVTADSLYLCDSGAQFFDGTTDITRTMHFGIPTAHEKRCFTRVLQGHIAVARAVFPHGTSAEKLDILARLPLWQDGLDFRHGTGHGVGCFLGVHEGPTLISYKTRETGHYFINPMEVGMTVTIEPGYYEDGSFGIRIENDMIVVEKETPHQFGDVKYLGFESLTLVPIQTKLVDASLLSDSELSWLNDYNARCYSVVGPTLPTEIGRAHV